MVILRPFTSVLISITLSILPGLLGSVARNNNSTSTANYVRPIPAFSASEPTISLPLLETSSWFTSTDNGPGASFGVPTSMSGDTLVIGDSDDSHDAPWSGSAYVFVKDGAGWVQQQKLNPTIAANDQVFGASVSISGNTIVVGAPGEGPPSLRFAGTAYVFVRTGSSWVLQQKATNGAEVLVGPPGKAISGPSCGAVYYARIFAP